MRLLSRISKLAKLSRLSCSGTREGTSVSESNVIELVSYNSNGTIFPFLNIKVFLEPCAIIASPLIVMANRETFCGSKIPLPMSLSNCLF